jgi:hypothetical protein
MDIRDQPEQMGIHRIANGKTAFTVEETGRNSIIADGTEIEFDVKSS